MEYNPVKELELYLIRHGQSMGNAGYGRDDLTIKEACDPYLTDKGINQAVACGKYLAETEFDAFYSSGLLRAVQTANEIMKFQKGGKGLNILPLLTEVGIGDNYDGAGMEEIHGIRSTARLADGFDENSPLVCHSSMNDENSIYERAAQTVEYFRNKYKNGEKIAVVSHAAFMTFLVFGIMGFTKSPVFDIDFDNTNITKVVFYKEGTNRYGDIVFEYINNTAHLELYM